jgi:DNA adenine methylase
MKSLLKWVGGKAQIIKDINGLLPDEINNYYEPFLGGGTVLLDILTLHKNGSLKINGSIIVNDLNQGLINFYSHIKSNPIELYNQIRTILDEYSQCQVVDKKSDVINRKVISHDEAIKCTENYYYWIRSKFNRANNLSIEHAAMFWFLNKTCFRGMYREGPNGYNVPFGHYKKPPSIILKDIQEMSKLIRDVIFRCGDFTSFFKDYLSDINANDFVYFDPPYAPETATSFVGYNKEGFTLEKHQELFKLIKRLPYNCKWLMSNAKVDLVVNEFNGYSNSDNSNDDNDDNGNEQQKNYKIVEIECKRHINAKKPGSKTMEVLISNY